MTRDVKAVHSDVHALLNADNSAKKRKMGLIVCRFDTVHVEFQC